MSDATKFADERIALVQALGEKFGDKKLTLRRDHSIGPNEHIWCVPKTEEDNRKMIDDNSSGEKIRVYLVNMPLPWAGKCWGAEVIGTTAGKLRPFALLEDQSELDAETELLWQGLAEKDAETAKEFGETSPNQPRTIH